MDTLPGGFDMRSGRLECVGTHVVISRRQIRWSIVSWRRMEKCQSLFRALLDQRKLRLYQVPSDLQIPGQRLPANTIENLNRGIRSLGENERPCGIQPVGERGVASGKASKAHVLLCRRQIFTGLHVRTGNAGRFAVAGFGPLGNTFAPHGQDSGEYYGAESARVEHVMSARTTGVALRSMQGSAWILRQRRARFHPIVGTDSKLVLLADKRG